MSDIQDPTAVSPGADVAGAPEYPVEPTPYDEPADTTTAPQGENVIPVDVDGDGVLEGMLHTFADGTWIGSFDVTGDGDADLFAVSTTGSEVPDLLISEDGSGGYVAEVDTDGDGTPDTQVPMSREQLAAEFPAALEYLDLNFAAAASADPATETAPAAETVAAEGDWQVVEGQLIGDPWGASEHWFEQAANGFCVPASVTQMVAAYTGTEFADESFFVERANELRLFTVGPDGAPSMTAEGAATLLRDVGLDAHVENDASFLDLQNYVNDGRPVMLAIDSGEMWYGEDDSLDDAADHAVVLTAIDPVNGIAVISDPGSPTGDQYTMSLAELEAIWEDSDHQLVVIDGIASDDAGPAADGAADVEPVDAFGAAAGAAAPAATPGSGPLDLEAPSRTDHLVSWLREHPSIAIAPIVVAGAMLARRPS